MQRNFDRRIEIAFPVLEAALQNRLKEYSKPNSPREPILWRELVVPPLEAPPEKQLQILGVGVLTEKGRAYRFQLLVYPPELNRSIV